MDFVADLLFWVIAGLTAGSAIATVITQNIVRCATWLFFTLCGTSALYFLLGADLVGATQLLVYVGGTLVLVVFGVMLTAQGPFIQMKSSGGEWAIAVIAGVSLLGILSYAIIAMGGDYGPRSQVVRKQNLAPAEGNHSKKRPHGVMSTLAKYSPMTPRDVGIPARDRDPADLRRPATAENSKDSATLGLGFIGVGVGPPHYDGDRLIRTHYLFPFEIVSIHLLVVLIGAAYLARSKRRKGAGTP